VVDPKFLTPPSSGVEEVPVSPRRLTACNKLPVSRSCHIKPEKRDQGVGIWRKDKKGKAFSTGIIFIPRVWKRLGGSKRECKKTRKEHRERRVFSKSDASRDKSYPRWRKKERRRGDLPEGDSVRSVSVEAGHGREEKRDEKRDGGLPIVCLRPASTGCRVGRKGRAADTLVANALVEGKESGGGPRRDKPPPRKRLY